MAQLKTVLTGYTAYRGREGQAAFLLHRICGLGVVLFLTIHILDTATVYFIPALYKEAIALYRSPLFGIGEIFLIFCVLYHGANGLRIAFFDLAAPRLWTIPSQRRSFWITLGVALALWLPAALVMIIRILAG